MYRVLHGDARSALAGLDEDSIDLILTDPPYNLGPHSTGNLALTWRKDFNNDVADWDRDFDPADWRDGFLRVLKSTGNLFYFFGL